MCKKREKIEKNDIIVWMCLDANTPLGLVLGLHQNSELRSKVWDGLGWVVLGWWFSFDIFTINS